MKTLSSGKNFKDYFLLFFLSLVVYWPLAANLLSLKNDALVAYLPYRYQVSEAVRNGYFPFWSPYFYTGFPIHADIQGAAWNPLVLFLSLISKYDMTILQWEVLIYLFLSAVGMYRLVKHFGLSRITAICCAVAFMSCGYITDSVSVIPWIPSAAFIPFVLLYFLRLLRTLVAVDAIKLSICLSLMFLCGYPSFFIYLNYILAFGFLCWIIFEINKKNRKAVAKAVLYLALSYLLFLLICSPAMISYYDFLPFYSRGTSVTYAKAGENPLILSSVFSYLIPNAASKASFLQTDLSMRNSYIGLFIFLFFLLSLGKLNPFKSIILFFTVFSFLFSLGHLTPIQKWSYHLLPLINTFRHPGTIRIFTSIGMILLAAFSLDRLLKEGSKKNLQRICYLSLGFLVSFAVYCIATNSSETTQVGFSWNPAELKQFLYSFSFQKFALIICLLQIVFIGAFLFLQRKFRSQKAIAVCLIFNSIVFGWIALPFTVVSQYKTSDVNHFIHSFPNGYPLPDVNASTGSEVYSDSAGISIHGYPNFYDKRITIQDHIITPTLNTSYYTFLEDSGIRKQLKGHPFVYVTSDSVSIKPATIQLVQFTPNHFSFRVNSSSAAKLMLFQQYSPNWKVLLNGKPVNIEQSNIAFMSVNIPAGVSSVQWTYHPKKVYIALIISALSLLAIVFYFVLKRKQDRIYE